MSCVRERYVADHRLAAQIEYQVQQTASKEVEKLRINNGRCFGLSEASPMVSDGCCTSQYAGQGWKSLYSSERTHPARGRSSWPALCICGRRPHPLKANESSSKSHMSIPDIASRFACRLRLHSFNCHGREFVLEATEIYSSNRLLLPLQYVLKQQHFAAVQHSPLQVPGQQGCDSLYTQCQVKTTTRLHVPIWTSRSCIVSLPSYHHRSFANDHSYLRYAG